MTPNLAFARLQHKQVQGNSLVDLTQPTVNHTSEAMEVVISDDEPEIIEHLEQEGVDSWIEQPPPQVQQLQHPHPHELSLQDRLRNLAGNISISNSFNLLNEKLNFMTLDGYLMSTE